MRLWLDDIREPWKHGFLACEWAKTADRAIELLQAGEVTFASLDRDLTVRQMMGEDDGEKTGEDVLRWMETNNVWPPGGVVVHSRNQEAKARMQAVIDKHYKRVSSSG